MWTNYEIKHVNNTDDLKFEPNFRTTLVSRTLTSVSQHLGSYAPGKQKAWPQAEHQGRTDFKKKCACILVLQWDRNPDSLWQFKKKGTPTINRQDCKTNSWVMRFNGKTKKNLQSGLFGMTADLENTLLQHGVGGILHKPKFDYAMDNYTPVCRKMHNFAHYCK